MLMFSGDPFDLGGVRSCESLAMGNGSDRFSLLGRLFDSFLGCFLGRLAGISDGGMCDRPSSRQSFGVN